MSSRSPSLDAVVPMAEAVARSATLDDARRTLIDGLSRELHVRVHLFEQRERGWALVAGERDAAASAALRATLDRLAPGELALVPAPPGSQIETWTAIALPAVGGPGVAVVMPGDWSSRDGAVMTWPTLVSLALATVTERQMRCRANLLMIRGYAMARRLSRLGSVDEAAQRVADSVGRLLAADRVAVALYRPGEDCLVVSAARGYEVSTVESVRISPGAWVIGHVHATGRPIVVRDVRKVEGMARERRPYRTFSFAAAPMFAGDETVGVLAVTDKRDGSAFTREDLAVLRTASVTAAVSLVAARSQAEASRLGYAATVDSLTGLFNRPYLDQRLHQEIERARRSGHPLTLLMADIDDFKSINDAYGHQIGDAVLQVIGGILRSAVRVFDVCARYGGDEFAILMPNSNYPSAAAAAERIRERVASFRREGESGAALPALTISIGLAVMTGADTAEDLMLRADRSLYRAKADGKNVVRGYAPPWPVGSPAVKIGREPAS